MPNDLKSVLNPEEKLLLSLCRLDFTEEQKQGILKLMEGRIDWERFISMANEHGAIALCRYNLINTGNRDLVPDSIFNQMHSAYLKNLARNAFLNTQLNKIASLAEKNGIKVILLKGLALEKTVYGNKGLRQMNDIDLLISQDNALLFRNLLLKNGFDSAPLVSVFHERIMPVYGKHLPEMYKDGIAVELHFGLFDENGNSLTNLFIDKAIQESAEESTIHYPDPQLLFLYLVSHLGKHEKEGKSQLRLYADLAVMLNTYFKSIINEKLFDLAIKGNIAAALKEKLSLLNYFWDIQFPEQYKIRSDTPTFRDQKEKFIWFLRHPFSDSPHPDQEDIFGLLKKVPGAGNRLLLVFGHLFPSLEYLKYRYHIKTKAQAFMFYPVRWILQTGKLARKTICMQLRG